MADENVYKDNLGLDEIVFENRNKTYGAYNLRKIYSKNLTKAFVLGTVVFCVGTITPFVVMKIKQMSAVEKTEVNANLIDIIPEETIIEQPKEEEPPPPPPPKEEPKIEVIQNVVPEPKRAPKVETPPPPITKQLETTTGLQNQEGVKAPSYTPPPPPPSTGTKAATVEAKPAPSTNEIYDEVEQGSEFPGGINAFRNRVGSSFDTSAMSGDEGTLRADVTFVVERDGTLTQVKATGSNSDFNREAERTIKSIRNKWRPAKINGQTVRSRFKLPLTMNFE